MCLRVYCLALLILAFATPALRADDTVEVKGRIELQRRGGAVHHTDGPDAVVWLTPVAPNPQTAAPLAPKHERLVQRDKTFSPHVMVIPAGSTVDFPNKDPFFHNVFSLFEGKRFDLGLYEAGTSRIVHFDRPGVCYIFCNIHPEMSAVVVVVDTSFYGISDKAGNVTIADVPQGQYTAHIWYEGGAPEQLKPMTRP